MFDTLLNAYLDYINNFFTVSAFADHYHLTQEAALHLINAGRACHSFSVELHQLQA
jgi:hypothetical protein